MSSFIQETITKTGDYFDETVQVNQNKLDLEIMVFILRKTFLE